MEDQERTKRKYIKFISAVLATILLSVVVYVPVMAASVQPRSFIGVPTETKVYIKSLNYSGKRILNVYTSGTPASGNQVTLYDDNGTVTSQRWYITNVLNGDGLYKVSPMGNSLVALNYNRATGNLTVYSYQSNINAGYANDCQIKIVDEDSNPLVANKFGFVLPQHLLCMTVTGSSNGSQVVWKAPSGANNQLWDITRG